MAKRERLLDNLLSPWQRRDPMEARDPEESPAPEPAGTESSVVGIAIYSEGHLIGCRQRRRLTQPSSPGRPERRGHSCLRSRLAACTQPVPPPT